jgi:ligand-binding SRPBCC domain-containing protein
MRIYILKREQVVPKPLETIFPFFTKAENLALITPPSLAFRVLTPSPVIMEQGKIIDYTVKLLGVEIRWRSMITKYEPPICFVDEQIKGPYSFWHHRHTFERRNTSTIIHDLIRYALPLSLTKAPGGLLHRMYVKPNLEEIFDYRRDVIARMFGGGGGQASTDATETEIQTIGGLA